MGNSLDKPVTEKETKHGAINLISLGMDRETNIEGSARLEYGVSCMQGWRTSMEDSYIVANDSHSLFGKEAKNYEHSSSIPVSLFAILDGHGGQLAAKFVSQEFCACLRRQEEFQQYLANQKGNDCGTKQKKRKKKKEMKDKVYGLEKRTANNGEMENLLKQSLKKASVEMDKMLMKEIIENNLQKSSVKKDQIQNDDVKNQLGNDHDNQIQCDSYYDVWDTGTTATIVLLTPTIILCSNIGDSRTILCRRSRHTCDQIVNVVPLSCDHKPSIPQEMNRIVNAGGNVSNNGLINGELAVSRGLGDFRFKNRDIIMRFDDPEFSEDSILSFMVSPIPDITVHHRNATNDQFLVLASDGIWDVFSNDECANFICQLFREGECHLGLVCEEVLDTCFKRGSRDNMAIIVIKMPGQIIGKGGGVKKRRARRQKAKYM